MSQMGSCIVQPELFHVVRNKAQWENTGGDIMSTLEIFWKNYISV